MEIRLPRLGEGADSGTVASVFVKEGDRVAKDQPILELESEKAVASIPSPAAGVVQNLHVKEGDVVKVGQLLMTLSNGGTEAPRRIDASVGDEERERAGAPPPAARPAVAVTAPAPVALESPTGPQPPASPTVRKIARDLGIDLRRIRGSEAGGRVILEDVRRYIQWLQETALQPAPAGAPATVSHPPAPPIDFSRWGPVAPAKMSTLRKTISTRMAESWTRVPHVTQFDEADITSLLALRKKYVKAYEERGARLTLTSFALRAVVQTLQHHPVLNASMQESTGEIIYKQYYHIGIAVDTEHGLFVPVIRDVNKKSMLDLSVEVQQLAEKARDRKLALEEMQGGSFSISNQGGIGGGFFTPIVNYPEVAILGIGRGSTRAALVNGELHERAILPLGLSYDHRLIDGANAARFIVDLVQRFEQFSEDDVRIA